MRLTAAIKFQKNTEFYLSFSQGRHFSGMTVQGILPFNISEHKEFISNIQKLRLYHTCKMSVYRCCRDQSGYGILVFLAFDMRIKCRHTNLLDIDNFSTKLAVCCCGYWLRLQPVLEPSLCEPGGSEVTFFWHVSYIHAISTTKWKFQLTHIRKRKSDYVGAQKLTKQISELQFSIKHSATNFKENSRNSKKIQGIQRKIVTSRTLFDP